MEPGSTHIQWKGTEVCMDLVCFCGQRLHIDAGFAYAVRCHACERVLELGTSVTLKDVGVDGDYFGAIVETFP